jgi:hypothetical protein
MAIITDSESEEWKRLREPPVPPRAVTIGTLLFLLFSIAFCALVFWAGWKERAVYQQCGLQGVLTAGRSCPALDARPPAAEAPFVR